jgi:hypothetical protein
MGIFLVPYAYDRVDRTRRTGQGTRARVCAALMRAHTYRALSVTAVLTAGYSKRSPASPSDDAPESLAHQMEELIKNERRKNGPFVRTIAKPRAWGTLAETKAAIAEIKSRSGAGDAVTVIIASNPFHLFGRVLICWFWLKPRGWTILFAPAWHRFTWKERAQEVLMKIPSYIFSVPASRRD